MRKSLILGLGNELLRDDRVGLVAARRVAKLAGAKADLALACVATLDLLPLIAGYEKVVVVDAFRSPDVPPGSALRATPESLPEGFGTRSYHTCPMRDLLALGRELGLSMPHEVSIHGLSVDDAETFGRTFTPAVKRAWRDWADGIAQAEFPSQTASAPPSRCESAAGRDARGGPGSMSSRGFRGLAAACTSTA